jgi:SAM-dependent methyltransferase
MAFKDNYDSHDHSLEILEIIYGYDSFLDSLTTIADMGCGAGFDAQWWAELYTRDDPPEPRNYTVYAVDQSINQIDQDILDKNPNLFAIEGDFEKYAVVPRKLDLIWSHDSFQYAKNPYECLSNWKKSMNANGMLILSLKQMTYSHHGKLVIESRHQQLFNYNILNLIYMLAINGFDCSDAYFYRKENTPWLYAAVYATNIDPLPITTSWHELAERSLINESLMQSVNRYGYARLEDLVVTWLDKNHYKITI